MSADYGMRSEFSGGLEAAEAAITEALKDVGFGILTRIDVAETLKKKIDVDFHPFKILGACNPKLAHRALTANEEVGLLLPCNVTLSQTGDNETVVSIIDPNIMMQVIEHPEVAAIAQEARDKLERALKNLE